ncbi:hypothetical protein GY21_00845 [Cryobacterium roopkundense]|uniref:Uncharacterized protein n=1 Tax=Cryobacterium roopkundense TaxID=1001240 RepID=A0A099JV86_9MICO|nr:hypothetical protein [Cryobacterium roopkundense]KGJ82349.1 hypothetical protein GY21_00845 [Cryobacterium roopkundense]
MTVSPSSSARLADAGFGLIEIAVSMFLLALLAVAFLPFLVQGVRQSSANGTLATGTQLVNKEMENAPCPDHVHGPHGVDVHGA